MELWVADTATAKARKIAGVAINAAHGEPVQWMPDSRTLLVQTIPAGRGKPPASPLAPKGPNIQESAGKAGPVRTLQDMLTSAHDEDLFDYYATAQLALVDTAGGKLSPIGKPAIFTATEPAPDGKHILVSRIHRPYSYLHSSHSFPSEIEVWDTAGKTVHKLASLPLADTVPIEGVPTGPRQVEWRADQPATLVWAEALDGGDPRRKVPHRDRLMTISAPFQGDPKEMLKLEQRFSGIDWSERGDFALVRDSERARRWSRTFVLDLKNPAEAPRLLWSRSTQDRYNAPGVPVQKTLASGQRAIHQSGDSIFLYNSQGATPQGDRPFLDRFDMKTGKSERLFRSAADSLRDVVRDPRRCRHAPADYQGEPDRAAQPLPARGRIEPGESADEVRGPRAAVARHPQATGHLQARRRRAVLLHPVPAAGLQRRHAAADRGVGLSLRIRAMRTPPGRSPAPPIASRCSAARRICSWRWPATPCSTTLRCPWSAIRKR